MTSKVQNNSEIVLSLKKIYYFCRMKEEVSIKLISRESDLPYFESHNFFHSVEFFRMLEATPRLEPCMAVAEDGQGNVVAHMLTTIFYHRTLLPPAVYSHGRVYGEGEYTCDADKESIFRLFLEHITRRFDHHLCLYIEFSNLSSKMFGYENFRKCGYFPVQWQEIHNSLHSMEPDARLTSKTQARIAEARRHGVTSHLAAPGSKELRQAVKLIKSHFMLKPRRTIPSHELFEKLATSNSCRIFVTKYNGHTIGTCVCIHTGGNAYMWHLATRRKSFRLLHTDTYTVWAALTDAYEQGMRHMYFLDAGLPFKKSPMREFVMGFGGKPVSKYRWFRFPIPWINKIIDWLYNE